MNEKTALVTARVPEELKKAFDDAASRNDRTASQLIRDFMREYVRTNAQGDLLKAKR